VKEWDPKNLVWRVQTGIRIDPDLFSWKPWKFFTRCYGFGVHIGWLWFAFDLTVVWFRPWKAGAK